MFKKPVCPVFFLPIFQVNYTASHQQCLVAEDQAHSMYRSLALSGMGGYMTARCFLSLLLLLLLLFS
jgi:hypothetical protein